MMRSLLALGLSLLGVSAWAQDVSSGPDVGSKPPALKVFDVTGKHEGKEIDYTADRKELPTVYLFVNAAKFDRPMARFLRELDTATQNDGGDRYVVAVWVGGDAAKLKDYLPRVQMSIKLDGTAMAVHEGDATGPEGWVLNSDAHLTAVVCHKGKVAAKFGYQSINETDVPAVRKALTKAIGK
ncbi:hypothetical protein [Tuwongella immobilis]|uniref:Thioredoxin domain-containing protein n=1 Tax=Tuwongella immobilis TaxID=692036 RepID=A0A6C2YKI3_9BACT|nr:hypothetical protein [Tuwongella immobilis]VIP01422.1 Uncharacterized protein OS=Pirellula staleyi (strain ATCC 27377 / DSM 6068 / ICPB 4128) GN=Psta_1571 PE=4 SV=1 [Tuwongella immobilis]VTR98358.1 Uncharacterized protein OS=Pirellula staleyi (strain ATCC 27377 / DSM 6068 / ICPB 4128) GN=Psta_1571 PE=4 SV=1 [Tuwongella immobilis]